MKRIEVKEIHPCSRELEIQVPAGAMEEEFNSVCKKLGRGRRVPGFRPGKAPLNILKQYLGEEARSKTISNQVRAAYFEGIKEENLKVVGDPRFSEIDWPDGGDLRFKVSVDIRPAIEVKDYRGIRLTRKKNIIEEEDIDRTLESLLERTATYEKQDDRPLAEGDWALVDYRPVDPPDQDWTEGGLLEIEKSGREEIGFQLIGLEPGQTRSVNVAPPASPEGEESGGSPREFEVRLREVKRKVIPEITDEWARTWGEFQGVKELREKVREDISLSREMEARREMEKQVIDGFLKKYDFPLPPGLLDSLSGEYLKEISDYAGRRQSPEGDGPSEEELKKLAARRAENDLKLHYIMAGIIEKENIEADRGAIGEELERLARQKGVTSAEVRRELEESGRMGTVIDRILRQRAMDFLIENAKIKEIN